MNSGTSLTHRRTKLVCTIGPATVDRVHELVRAGMDVARLNFSHGTPAGLARSAMRVREAAADARRPVALLVDLSGPKIRLGDLAEGAVRLEAGAAFMLRPNERRRPGDASGARVTYPAIARDVRRGDRVFLADGAVELRVTGVTDDAVATEVVRGGAIRSRAGVSVPSERLSTPALTDKDRRDVPRALAMGADYVAQSFVRSGNDLRQLRALLGPDGPPIVAKIETRPAVDDFDAILDEAGAVMIARGDLGVELPYEEVPLLQKQLVRRALERGVPSIVATQMLESMTAAPRPTRAEASDVANAVFDGTDAVMLSGETAIGAYPVLAAEAAIRIVRACEEQGSDHLPHGSGQNNGSASGALAQAAVTLVAARPGIAAIACYTRTGRTAHLLSALRPRVPIVAFSPDPAVVRRLGLVHGVEGRSADVSGDEPNRLELLASLARAGGVGSPGEPVVLVASTGAPGSGPNAVEVIQV